MADQPAMSEAQAQEETEKRREDTRRRIAYALIGTLVIVVVASFVYIILLSFKANELSLDALVAVIQAIGTTLLAPLTGLIGAVVGFYYGGQTAVQGSQTATQAATQAAQAAADVARAAARPAGQEQREGAGRQERPDG
jgi:uncharacterized membrane protein